jgi:hypothetical protein
MNWGKIRTEVVVAYSKYFLRIFTKGLRATTKSRVRIAGNSAENRIKQLWNTVCKYRSDYTKSHLGRQ